MIRLSKAAFAFLKYKGTTLCVSDKTESGHLPEICAAYWHWWVEKNCTDQQEGHANALPSNVCLCCLPSNAGQMAKITLVVFSFRNPDLCTGNLQGKGVPAQGCVWTWKSDCCVEVYLSV